MDLSQFPTIRVAACDLNGQARGKRMSSSSAAKLDTGSARMPLSALNVDLWGNDIDGSPLVFESGDQDGTLFPTGRSPVPMPWLAHPSALVPVWMFYEDGRPFDGDPRHALARVLDRYAARGWTVIAATELEFTLMNNSGDTLHGPAHHMHGRFSSAGEVLSIRYLDAFDGFFTELYSSAKAMGIPADSAISECGAGQFEINLTHQEAMRAADDTWLFKDMVKGIARKHGMAATFMAKPYPDDAGNGLHVHFSVVDMEGKNVFDNRTPYGNEALRSAVAGCLAAMPDSTLIFAPHGNSYARLIPGQHAPTAAQWGYENRTVALRIPSGPNAARRIEHRVAGGDTNPYLMLTAVLGAAITGIEDGLIPPDPVKGNAYKADAPSLAATWSQAIDQIETSEIMRRIFVSDLIRNLVMTKRQELRLFAERDPETHIYAWLDRV